jgi:hypothetical protein
MTVVLVVTLWVLYRHHIIVAYNWCWGYVYLTWLNKPLYVIVVVSIFFALFYLFLKEIFDLPNVDIQKDYVEPFLNWGLDDYKKPPKKKGSEWWEKWWW